MDTKVNTGCTVTPLSRHRVEASGQLPAGVQSRLMGSKKALRKRGNFRNSKTTNSLNRLKVAGFWAKLHWILCKLHLKVVCTGALGTY